MVGQAKGVRPSVASGPTSETFDPRRLDSEEYLDRCGVTAYLKDVVTLLLENQPAKPIDFLADYFRTVIQGSSPLLRAYRYVRLASPSQDAFTDNLVAAYHALDVHRGSGVVAGSELLRLLRLIGKDFPINITRSLLLLIEKRETDPIDFAEFSVAVRSCSAGRHPRGSAVSRPTPERPSATCRRCAHASCTRSYSNVPRRSWPHATPSARA